jgi:hypothetical protein
LIEKYPQEKVQWHLQHRYFTLPALGMMRIKLKNIAEAAGVTEVTIRNRVKDLRTKGIASIAA